MPRSLVISYLRLFNPNNPRLRHGHLGPAAIIGFDVILTIPVGSGV